MLGISTCWWHNRTDRGDEIVSDILRLGLKGVELEYRITDSVYQQMKPKLKRKLTVLSIHNFFPKPEGLTVRKGSGDLFLLSSTDREERSKAVEYTIRTMEYADDLEASAVVLHLGRVDMSNPTPRLTGPYGTSHLVTDETMALLEEQKLEREARHERYLDAVLFSMEKLNKEAEKRGVFLGIENRYHFHEIPNFEEIGIILERFRGGNVRYWHDVGHALAQEKMGIVRQKDLLEAYWENMLGIHLHDVKGHDDHFSPGQGEVDYEAIKPFLQSSHIKIMEVHPKVDREDLMKGIRLVKNLGIM